ncbi:MAG: hypothetical protein A3I66_01280 [Burkholderiales bacterium RIFCSPLOWO2_02_FULL_57_36]|nr:MAG: hypothetical protein A3I66_01280 [Burkholderiales bacterium RIFCSPLOWO2_02_FULL_57_36]
MGTWGFVALVAVLAASYLVSCKLGLKHIVDNDSDFLVAVPDDARAKLDDGIEWYPSYVLPEAKGQYWTKHPEAPNHVFEGTRWNGNMWISEDGHPCYFQSRDWAYPVEQAAA